MDRLLIGRDIVTNNTVIFVDDESRYDRIQCVNVLPGDLVPYQSGDKNSLAEIFYTRLLINADEELEMAKGIARTDEVHKIGGSVYRYIEFKYKKKEQNDEDKFTDPEGPEAECAG